MDDLPENAPDYESRADPISDNEYLHYINHKLGYTNAMIIKLYRLMTFFCGAVVVFLLWIILWR